MLKMFSQAKACATGSVPCENKLRVPIKIRVPEKRSWMVRFLLHPAGKTFLAIFVIALTVGAALFTYYYEKYAKIIDAKLSAGPFRKTPMFFSAPPHPTPHYQPTPPRT